MPDTTIARLCTTGCPPHTMYQIHGCLDYLWIPSNQKWFGCPKSVTCWSLLETCVRPPHLTGGTTS